MSEVKRLIVVLLPLVIAATLSGCSGANSSLTAESPRDEGFRTALKKEMSVLNVPIEASAEELGRTLNQTLRKDLYKGSTKTRGLTADIVRNGPLAISAADNFLYCTLPVTMSLSYGIFETPAIPLTLKFRSTPRITPEWKLVTEIYYTGLSDLLAEKVGIGPLSLKPRSIVEGLTQPLQQMLSEAIEKKINEKFPLKSKISKVWFAAQKPILANKNYNAWLKVTPLEVMLSPLQTRNNRIKLSVGIKSFTELVIGPEPATPTLVPLPNLKLVNNFDKSFRIALNVDLFYQDLLTIASPLLLDKEFTSDGKKIVIKDFDLYGSRDKFVIKIATTGSLEGIFYLTGKPRFNSQTNIFSVEDVDFDMQTRSLLLQSADWFLHGTIRSRIQEKLNMDLTKRLEQSRELARKAIAQIQLAEHLHLRGDIKALQFRDALILKDKISIQLSAEGESAIYFQ
ncbi:MAG: DUF4403 family protein [Deltaproteobacteria bacterium]|nr:DUF4403 family protein [Deltaproteobacteria bacterium]TLN04159.1 MAG: DUF4403 family protein [bacterium]